MNHLTGEAEIATMTVSDAVEPRLVTIVAGIVVRVRQTVTVAQVGPWIVQMSITHPGRIIGMNGAWTIYPVGKTTQVILTLSRYPLHPILTFSKNVFRTNHYYPASTSTSASTSHCHASGHATTGTACYTRVTFTSFQWQKTRC
jgi:hypothetical protein